MLRSKTNNFPINIKDTVVKHLIISLRIFRFAEYCYSIKSLFLNIFRHSCQATLPRVLIQSRSNFHTSWGQLLFIYLWLFSGSAERIQSYPETRSKYGNVHISGSYQRISILIWRMDSPTKSPYNGICPHIFFHSIQHENIYKSYSWYFLITTTVSEIIAKKRIFRSLM